MEYNDANQWYMTELVKSLNEMQEKYTKKWRWVAKTTAGEWVFVDYVYIRCTWKWSEKPTYGIPEVEWTIAEVLNGCDMSAKKITEESVVIGNNDDSNK